MSLGRGRPSLKVAGSGISWAGCAVVVVDGSSSVSVILRVRRTMVGKMSSRASSTRDVVIVLVVVGVAGLWNLMLRLFLSCNV